MKTKRRILFFFATLASLATIVRGEDVSVTRDAQKPLHDANSSNERKNYGEAIKSLTESIRNCPSSEVSYYSRGCAYANIGDFDSAIKDFTVSLRLNSKYYPAYKARAMVYDQRDDFIKAIADYDEAIRFDPQSALTYYRRGYAFLQIWKSEAIVVQGRKVLPKPGIEPSHENRAAVFTQSGLLDRANEDFSSAIQIDPMYIDAYICRGATYERKGEFEKADSDYGSAIRLYPANPIFYERRGAERIRNGKLESGMADLHAAIKFHPDDPAAKFEAWSKPPFSVLDIEYGEQQLKKMLRDRPAMAQYGDKAAVLYQWASKKFAGEDLHEPVLWDSSEPMLSESVFLRPTPQRVGRIRIRKMILDGDASGKEQSFERLWGCAVFELYNITISKDFERIERDAANGKLTREEFVTRTIDCELRAAEKCRAFYIHVFLPWAIENRVQSNPNIWYVATKLDAQENSALSHIDRRGPYWTYYERRYEEIRGTIKGSEIKDVRNQYIPPPPAVVEPIDLQTILHGKPIPIH